MKKHTGLTVLEVLLPALIIGIIIVVGIVYVVVHFVGRFW
jgi:hypothetical protein